MRGATNHLTPGQRVAYYRRRRGLSQAVLADLVGKTVSWVEKIESGRANLQMLPNIVRLAEVLDIAPAELLPDDIADVDATTRGRSVPALRQRLLSYRFVNPIYLADASQPLSVAALTAAVDSLWGAYQEARFSYVVAGLHRILPVAAATVGAALGAERALAEVQFAYTYQVGSCVLTKLGEQDLAFTCADRGDRLVQGSDDPAAKSSIQRSIAHALLANGHYEDALAVVEHTLRLTPLTSEDPQLLSAIGTLHLVGAMTAARMGDRATAQDHLRSAGRAASDLGRDANYLWTAFGPTNVAIHQASVAAELGDFQRAAALGEPVDVSPLPRERQVRHRLEVARALHYQRRKDDALSLVLTAEQRAPDQVRRHFLTHALLHEWITSKTMRPSAALHGLARRAGVLAA